MKYLTTQEAAQKIGVTDVHVCWLIRNGRIKARSSRQEGHVYEISEKEVQRYAKSPRKRGPKPRK